MDHLLSKLASSVTEAETLEGLTRPLLELLNTITGLESTYLTTVDAKEGVQHVLFARNSKTLQIPEGLSVPWHDTLCKRALDENRPYANDVAERWCDSVTARELGLKTYLSQPVNNLDGGLYGTLCAASSDRITVSPDTLKILGLFSRLISHQVERERLMQSLREANDELTSRSLTDPLTGVANRRALFQELQRVLERAKRERHIIHVAFIDLDGFKAINDKYGHDVGDRFLIQVANKLSACIRSYDFLARYGGDEFVVIALNADLEDLRMRLQRSTVGKYVCNDNVIEYAGASVGVVESISDDTNVETLLSRADAAMYANKRSRRT